MYNILKIYFLAINLFAMIIMFVDKKKAIKKHWRISEFNLLLIALLGGSIGEYIGMYLFRHKTKHIKFTLGIPVIFLLQILILISFIK
ncbi:DUF1294 domain-containing protein [Clostridium chauvoei]|uniref:DUF1294 domain-containing protein n=2 Tax=Clostridium chauvoei TaxID=46867 RepID=A0ABD4RI44_9CLOT|nr:DUF1294 domain-containing protein [Clostridium chauvoei]ATD55332.1 hypothetical protein BTM20_08815 [Clostridium chauvoei]MBX7280844.1 DUF1294 domain-containing protein [Clostridium chauvoei]MBX7283327.1 DUF1294 domain-containing protein [Clostridium chauvoei]MBX7288331.1 DUF1294 domain-containing protein [Clostridium chauvoei]MBX7290930.1 DUF1294 domain-containing protein [Clostridium chauvoei]